MDPARAKELLARERERIEQTLAEIAPTNARELSDQDEHLADYASDLYQAEYEEGLAEQLHGELAVIERAEARLAAGTYGLSIESGVPIPDERLEAFPMAERTVEEEERFEHGPP